MRCGSQLWPPSTATEARNCPFPVPSCTVSPVIAAAAAGCTQVAPVRTPGRLSLGADERAAARDRRGRQMMSFGSMLSGSPGPWGWHLPSNPHPHRRLDFVTCVSSQHSCQAPAQSSIGDLPCPLYTHSHTLSSSLSHFHYIYSGWLRFHKTENTAVFFFFF